MGFTLRDMIYEIGGGVPNGKRQAVQIGGRRRLPPEPARPARGL